MKTEKTTEQKHKQQMIFLKQLQQLQEPLVLKPEWE